MIELSNFKSCLNSRLITDKIAELLMIIESEMKLRLLDCFIVATANSD